MKNDSSEKFYAWFDVSNNLDDERSWIRKYIEFDRTKRTLTLYSNDCIQSSKPAPIVDLNSEMISLSSSATSSSSSSSLCTSSILTNNNSGRSSVSVRRPSYMLQSLSEYMSPSLSKAFFSSSTANDDKTATLTPLNNNPIQSNSIRLASFTDSLSDRLSSITTTTTRQSKTKFSYFFGRSSANNKSSHNQQPLPSPNINIDSLKRTKSVTKLERQKRLQQPLLNPNNQQISPSLHNIPTNRSRSHESLFVLNGTAGNGPLGSISTTIPSQLILDHCHIRRLHPSILQAASDINDEHFSPYQCVQIRNKNEKKNYYLRSKQYSTDSSLLINNLRQTSLETITNLCGLRTDNSLDIWILEAKGLPVKKKYYVKIFLDDGIYGKTTSKERREILFWGENFTFKDIPEGCSTLRCKIYRETERRKQKQVNGNDIDLIGYVDIPLSTITGNQFIEQWYPLQIPSGLTITGKEKSQRLQDGSFNIRIKAKYQAIQILPIESYLHLQEYIRRDYLRLIRILEPHISLRDKDEIATSLTRIAQSLSFSTSFLVDIVQAEILSTPDNSLMFRGNSIATKSMEAYMKLIGETYLRETLTRFVTDIVSSKNSNDMDLEVDPGRVSNLQNLERNQITLRLLCEKIWLEIQQSHSLFPQELKRIFWKLRQLSSSDETMFNLISGSVFLRFLCPAILSPNLFGLTQEYPNEKSSRKLTLIAKTLQTLANFSKFGPKESYMKFMNDFVGKESENMRRFLAQISTIDHDYDEPRYSHRNNLHDDKCDIDLGREYSILHSTLADLFEQIDFNTRRTLNELEYVLTELTNIKLFYATTQNGTQIHLHHHHHHIYHHLSTPSEHYYNRLDKQPNDNRLSPYGSQISLSLTGTGTTNDSSQGYHSISESPTITTVENLNKENIRTPLSFKNPIFNNQKIQIDDNNHSDLSDDDNQINLNQTLPDSSKALYFINSLCIESLKNSSSSSTSQQSLVHSASRQSLQQPLFVLNNSYMTRSTQSLASSANMNTPIKTNNSTSTTYYCVKAQDQFNGANKRQSIVSSQQLLPPKMGVKALNHTSTSNKDIVIGQRSPLLNLYQEEKCRRIESEKQAERLHNELHRSNEQIEEYRHLIGLLNEKSFTTNIDNINLIDYSDDGDDDDEDNSDDNDVQPIEKNFCLDDNTENKFIFLYSKPPLPPDDEDDDDDLSILSHLENAIE
ncbi:unnamed protein product [Rotaria socialis]|uniref:Ras GTPase-activating protein n=1 Tax=Rotaria socialis TaxID=392032 RepID=A0A817WJ60_9BILA|nr:unnamed protein product [Rotaria socialis]CAF3463866.1 unnamed protein product [Rotaria socialis]CAF3778057.1 unnamed protein product [Rotaria socialis]